MNVGELKAKLAQIPDAMPISLAIKIDKTICFELDTTQFFVYLNAEDAVCICGETEII